MTASRTTDHSTTLIPLVDRFLALHDEMERQARGSADYWEAFKARRAAEIEIIGKVAAMGLTRGGRLIVPVLHYSSSFGTLKVFRYRDLDMEEYVGRESAALAACNRAFGAGEGASPADLATLAGEIRWITECSEREALQAARGLARLGGEVAAPADLAALAALAEQLVADARRRPRDTKPGPGRE